jgi:type F conjugative transfer system protein TrbI
MPQNNGDANGGALSGPELIDEPSEAANTSRLNVKDSVVTRTKLRARQSVGGQNRILLVAGGLVVLALIVFAVVSAPRWGVHHQSNVPKQVQDNGAEKRVVPVTESGHPVSTENQAGYLNERDVSRTATKKESITPVQPRQNAIGSLGAIPPFGEQPWQAPPYQPKAPTATIQLPQQQDPDAKALNNSSLVFVRAGSSEQANSMTGSSLPVAPLGLGLPVGTRLRAKLESSASTAVHTPVLAVIEYNYERDGEIIVPAGAKAIGQIEEADRSGYVRIQFDTLLLPDGTTVRIQAAATNLHMRPLKGKVEGNNTGKNILVRSLSGVGEAAALLVGHGSLNEPLNESDLIRERISNDVGQASNEQFARLAVTSRVVVTIPAGDEVYVVLEQSSKPIENTAQGSPSPTNANLEQLRKLWQLQQELASGKLH